MKQIEARFVVSSSAVFDEIQECGKLGGYELQFKERQLFVTNYYDTEHWDLLKAKTAVKVRRAGRACTLAFNAFCKRNAKIQITEDIEEPLGDGYPEKVDHLDCKIMERVKSITRNRPLLVVLTVENNRTVFEMIRYHQTRFAMVLNDVEFVGSRDQRRHFEMEIESTGGDKYELSTLLSTLTSGLSLEPSAETRFEQGLRLMRAWPVGIKW